MKYIYYILLASTLFIGPNVLTSFNINANFVYAGILAVSIALVIWRFNELFSKQKKLVVLLGFITLVCAYKLLSDSGENIRYFSLILLLSPYLYASFPLLKKKTLKIWKQLSKILFIFYGVECGIAIYERIFTRHIFIWTASFSQEMAFSEGFRSISLHGHPLQNALIISIIMNYILMSELRLKYKFPLWCLGLIAILSFNSRFAILINCLFVCIYVIFYILANRNVSRKQKNRIWKYVFIVGGLILIAFQFGLGNRLLTTQLIDGSAQVRLDIWNIFNNHSLSDFLWGIPPSRLQYIMYQQELYATENFWLDYIFSYGLVFTCVLVFLYYIVLKRCFSTYPTKNSLFITLAFLIISSSNNSLSSSYMPLFILLFCSTIFSPRYSEYLFPSKYLERT